MNVPGGSVTEATISSLKSSTTYFIQVAAVNSAGIGVYSGSMNATTDGTHHNHSTLYNIIYLVIDMVFLCAPYISYHSF